MCSLRRRSRTGVLGGGFYSILGGQEVVGEEYGRAVAQFQRPRGRGVEGRVNSTLDNIRGYKKISIAL